MLDTLRRALARPPRILEPTDRMSAVAAIFDPELHLLLIRRTERAGDPWSGHISLPGGRMEPADRDPLDTAIRETQEEIGVALSPSMLLGPLDDLLTVGGRPGMVIRPFVFGVDRPLTRFEANAEVASVHRLALQDLLVGGGRGRMTLEYRGQSHQLPCVDFEGLRLWGLTLQIVDDLLHRLDGRGTGLDRPMRAPPDLSR